MEFLEPNWLFAILALPLLAFLYAFNRSTKRRKLKQMGNLAAVFRNVKNESRRRRYARMFFFFSALLLLVIALANPRKGLKEERINREGIDVVIALDVSRSMLVEDRAPNRLTRAKQLVQKVLESQSGHRIGLVVFAGSAYMQMPLSADKAAAMMMLDASNEKSVSNQGTALAQALLLSKEILSPKESKTWRGGKVVLLISDGENHNEDWESALEELQKERIRVFTVGVGSAEGGPIPVGSGKFIEEKGEIVTSKLQSEQLLALSNAGEGKYYDLISVAKIVKELTAEFDKMTTKASEQLVFTAFRKLYPLVLGIALFLLLLEAYFNKPKGTEMQSQKTGLKSVLLFCAFTFIGGGLSAQSLQQSLFEAQEAIENEKLEMAEKAFQKAIEKEPNSALARYNYGSLAFQMQEWQNATEQFERAAELFEKPRDKANAFHNLGNCAMKTKNIEAAIDFYKRALKIQPSMPEARKNLAFALRQKKAEQEKQNQKEQESSEDDSEEQNDEDQKESENQSDPEQRNNSRLSDEEAQNIKKYLRERDKALQKIFNEQRAKAENADPNKKAW